MTQRQDQEEQYATGSAVLRLEGEFDPALLARALGMELCHGARKGELWRPRSKQPCTMDVANILLSEQFDSERDIVSLVSAVARLAEMDRMVWDGLNTKILDVAMSRPEGRIVFGLYLPAAGVQGLASVDVGYEVSVYPG